MIDNSASMYDMAYVDENDLGYCFDESYDNTLSYAGYFSQEAWYKYEGGISLLLLLIKQQPQPTAMMQAG